MTRNLLAGITALALSAICSSPASAATIYTYTGQLFAFVTNNPAQPLSYDKTMSVTGSFTVASPLAAGLSLQDISADLLSFSFNDGLGTLTNANAQGSFVVTTDASGALTQWLIQIATPLEIGFNEEIDTLNFFPGGGKDVDDQADVFDCTQISGGGKCTLFAENSADSPLNPGTWSAAAEPPPPTPLPAALPLFATGLGIMGLFGWRRKRKAQAAA